MTGPGHAAFCGNRNPHDEHRHTNGVTDWAGYEVCSGVAASEPPADATVHTITCKHCPAPFTGVLDDISYQLTVHMLTVHRDVVETFRAEYDNLID